MRAEILPKGELIVRPESHAESLALHAWITEHMKEEKSLNGPFPALGLIVISHEVLEP